MEEEAVVIAMRAGWAGFLGGVLSGAVIGLKFHNETWLGGYGSRERRMLRLGHIAFFGIGMICLFYALSLRAVPGEDSLAKVGAFALAVALVAMPSTCFLSPFPGTPLWQRFREEGRLLDEQASERATLFDINFRPDGLSVESLREGFVDLVGRLYDPSFVKQRETRFRQHLRAGVSGRRRTLT